MAPSYMVTAIGPNGPVLQGLPEAPSALILAMSWKKSGYRRIKLQDLKGKSYDPAAFRRGMLTGRICQAWT